MKRFLFFSALLFIFTGNAQSENNDSLKTKAPKIGGTIRTKYEYNTNLNASRFQVRNARFSTKMLDAYIRIKPISWFTFTLGQQKIPFSTDNLRSPYNFYFANRSFIGKQLTGLRDVGATVMFSDKHFCPMKLELGAYNGEGLYNQQPWEKELNYAARLEAFPVKEWEISLNYNSIMPEDMRMHFYDIGSYVQINRWHFETEFVYKTYENNLFKPTKGFFIFGAYDIPINKKYLKTITPLARYDMMTDNNKGYQSTTGTYDTDYIARSRVTSGITLSLDKPFLNDIRLNYEKYFYGNGVTDEDDKIVVEFVVKF